MFSINKCTSCKFKLTGHNINYCKHPLVKVHPLPDYEKLPDCRSTRIMVFLELNYGRVNNEIL